MILDTSALVAILRREPEREMFLALMDKAPTSLRMSAASYLEAGIVADSNDQSNIGEQLDAILTLFAVEIVPVTADHARAAYRRFGKGRHPARLNFGDCFAYALASVTGQPLLFKGDDFAATDIVSAA